MADRQRGGRLRGRVRGSDEGPEQRFSSINWSQMDPYEEGQMRDICNEERDIFGEMASELLEGTSGPNAPHTATDHNPSLRLRGAGSSQQSGPSAMGDSDPGGLTPEGGQSAGSYDLQDVCGETASAGQASGMNAEESGLHLSDYDPFLWGFQNRLSSEEPISPSGGNQQQTQGGRIQKTRGKKKLPVPDLDAIDDLAERRRQRRLIKNRNTAAASRERKQRQFDEITARTRQLEQDNADLRQRLDHRNFEIQHLQQEIAQQAASNLGTSSSLGPPSGQPLEAQSGSGQAAQGRSLSIGQPLQPRSREGCQLPSGSGIAQLQQPPGPGPGPQPQPQQPQSRSGGGSGSGLTASGLAATGRSGYIQGLDGQFLYLRPEAQQPQQQQQQQELQPAQWLRGQGMPPMGRFQGQPLQFQQAGQGRVEIAPGQESGLNLGSGQAFPTCTGMDDVGFGQGEQPRYFEGSGVDEACERKLSHRR